MFWQDISCKVCLKGADLTCYSSWFLEVFLYIASVIIAVYLCNSVL